ncbi:CerR family C-terminal domain-containing protein [Rhodoferax sp.]|uniref:CerR family C-terminal domain-containing protein n=1 Tax=Rhodoferax sp. TaxID=50421 RepID=UPI0025EC8A10|nr:CerR family C-terminal domain-containing protein [Rhodoferax sp.]
MKSVANPDARLEHTDATPQKPLRSDGQQARLRLLDAGLALFADKGFAQTSTREIAQTAQVNVAAISYYFGDKEGLYRAVFTDPRYNPRLDAQALVNAPADIRTTVRVLLAGLTVSLKQSDLTKQCMKLHFREMLQPTGVWQDEIDQNIKPNHQALVHALCQHLQLAQADDDVHRLAFSIAGLAVMLHVGHDVITVIRPKLIASPAAIDLYVERMLGYAMAMVDAEAERRATTRQLPTSPHTAS